MDRRRPLTRNRKAPSQMDRHGSEVFSRFVLIDSEMLQANRENSTLQWARNIGERPFMVIVAQYDEIINNDNSGKAALSYVKGPTEYIIVPDIARFEMYSGKPFEISSEAAARWFTTCLK